MSEAKHTKFHVGDIEATRMAVFDSVTGHFFAKCEFADNAAFIVRACNFHNDLLEVCKKMLARLESYADIVQHEIPSDSVLGVVLQARAVIAKATGETTCLPTA